MCSKYSEIATNALSMLYPNSVRILIQCAPKLTQFLTLLFSAHPLRKIIFKAPNLVRTYQFYGNLADNKALELLQNCVKTFLSQKFVLYKIHNTLKLFWFTIDSSVHLNEEVQFFFNDICHFFVYIADCIKLYKGIISKAP